MKLTQRPHITRGRNLPSPNRQATYFSGPNTAIVAAVGDARQFRNGRHLAAWLGLVPRQYSSGGKSRLYHISRRGETYLRNLAHSRRASGAAVRNHPDAILLSGAGQRWR
jgi:hypothetical protein